MTSVTTPFLSKITEFASAVPSTIAGSVPTKETILKEIKKRQNLHYYVYYIILVLSSLVFLGELMSLIKNWNDNGTFERTFGFLLMLTSGALVGLAGYDRYLAYKHTHEVEEKVRDECDRREAEYLFKHGEVHAAVVDIPEFGKAKSALDVRRRRRVTAAAPQTTVLSEGEEKTE
jgi:hypothetical protein